MATNKERIEGLESQLSGIQDVVQRMELGMNNKLHQIENTINRLSDALLHSRESSNQHSSKRGDHSRISRTKHEGSHVVLSSKMAKFEFPRYSGDDPTEWFNRVG